MRDVRQIGFERSREIRVYYGLIMTMHTEQPLSAFARDVVDMCRGLSGFEAIQTVHAGPIEVEAHVAWHRPDHLSIEFTTYDNPLLDLEQELTGDAEYTPDEIVGLSLHSDGQQTQIYDPSSDVCIVKPSRFLFEPLPELGVLGDLQYLRDLPHDFLLRDLGTETVDGRPTRALSLKPKHPHRIHAFKLVAFLARKLSIAFDAETLFPARLTFFPAPSTQAHLLLGAQSAVDIHYRNVRFSSASPSPFTPPEGARVFFEETPKDDRWIERLPFGLSLDPFRASGFSPVDGHAIVTTDEAHDRAYCTIPLVNHTDDEDEPSQIITLRVGNYLSRNMARRRMVSAETGERMTIADKDAWHLDRRNQWAEHDARIDASRAPQELSWQDEGVFWSLAGVNVDQSMLRQLAIAVRSSVDAS